MQPAQQVEKPAAVRTPANVFARAANTNRKIQEIKQSALFSNMLPADYTAVISAAHEKDFRRRQTMFFEGNPIRQIFLLTQGCVKLTQLSKDGSEVILRLNVPGEIVGAFDLERHGTHYSTAQALQMSKALVWDATIFETMSQCFPMLQRNRARILASYLEQLEERFREISTEKVAPRLAHELVRLLARVGRRVDGTFEIGLSREELAQMIGTTLFTVSRLLSQWEQQGLVTLRREAVAVRSLNALAAVCQNE